MAWRGSGVRIPLAPLEEKTGGPPVFSSERRFKIGALRAIGAAASALRSHRRGRRFDSYIAHPLIPSRCHASRRDFSYHPFPYPRKFHIFHGSLRLLHGSPRLSYGSLRGMCQYSSTTPGVNRDDAGASRDDPGINRDYSGVNRNNPALRLTGRAQRLPASCAMRSSIARR